jgi:hypothetical protein
MRRRALGSDLSIRISHSDAIRPKLRPANEVDRAEYTNDATASEVQNRKPSRTATYPHPIVALQSIATAMIRTR